MWKYFPNLSILTKSATPSKVQLNFAHTSVGNKPFGEYFTDFALIVLLEEPAAVSINDDIAFYNVKKYIRIPITKVLLRATVGNFTRLKKQRDWVALKAVLLPTFLMKATILDRKMSAANLLKVFSKCISKNGTEEEEEKSSEEEEDKAASEGE